jgi:lipopolysaccharide export system protein LptA
MKGQHIGPCRLSLLLFAVLSLLPLGAEAQQRAQPAAAPAAPQGSRGGQSNNPLGNLGDNSKGPIRIDAAKLEVFDGQQKAIYTGDVVAVRGNTVARTPEMTIFYEGRRNQPGQPAPRPAGGQAAGAGQDGSIKRIEFKGPVTVVSGTQTAKANHMTYDAVGKQIILAGDASIVDGENIQRGERIVYNTETRIATVTGGGPGGRVQTLITPGSDQKPGAGGAAPAAATRPAAAQAAPAGQQPAAGGPLSLQPRR